MIPPERIEIGIPGIALARQRVEHAAAVAEVARMNLDHLRPWMPWANEDATRAEFQRDRIVGVERQWDDGIEFQFVVLDGDVVVGSIGLMTRRGPGTLELGYWLAAASCGRGIVTAAARALTDWAQRHVPQVMIVCDAANEPSNAVARRLGFRLDRGEPRAAQTPAETGTDNVWVQA